jgi:transposase
VWRGWRIVLFVDRGSPHTAKGSRALARDLAIEWRFLPTACPELNPLEGLWRYVKGVVLANEPTPNLEAARDRACDEVIDMDPTERLWVAGVMSGNFWLPT